MKLVGNSHIDIRRVRATWADLGLHRMSAAILACQILELLLAAALCWHLRLRIEWATFGRGAWLVAAPLGAWAYYARFPGRAPKDWLVAESLLVVALLFSSTLIEGPAQYVAAAWNRPIIDPWLVWADRVMGVNVPALVAWTRQRPQLTYLLYLSYVSFGFQLLFASIVLGILLRDRAALWECGFHLQVCSTITIVVFALWPAACVFTTLGFTSLLDQTRFIDHFARARAGTLNVIRFADIEGLVSCPSFHVAVAWITTWVFRRYRLLFVLLLAINGTLTASTVLLGAHYAVDLIASAAMVGLSIAVYRRWAWRWVGAPICSTGVGAGLRPGAAAH